MKVSTLFGHECTLYLGWAVKITLGLVCKQESMHAQSVKVNIYFTAYTSICTCEIQCVKVILAGS